MAFRIIWTKSAREDLKAVLKYIKSDNLKAAESFGFRLIKEAESVAEFSRRGRMVPEENDPLIREVICSHIASRTESTSRIKLFTLSEFGIRPVANRSYKRSESTDRQWWWEEIENS